MSSSQSIGLSGLLTSQRLLDLIGHNIANAGTTGYHRQVATLAPRTYGQEIGLGVEIMQIRRVIDATLEAAITRNTFALHDAAAQLGLLRQIEMQLNPAEGSAHELLEQFFNQTQQLAGHPDDVVQRRVALTTASSLSDQLNAQFNEVQRIQGGVVQQLEDGVRQINLLTRRIADLNAAIQRNTIQNINPNDLADQRDILIGQLAELIDVRVIEQDFGTVNVQAAGVPLVLVTESLELETTVDAADQAIVTVKRSTTPLTVAGGKLRGLLALRNQIMPDVLGRLEAYTRTLVQTMDTVHATGLGLSGPFSQLNGLRAVTNVNAPLSNAGLAFPAQAGSLFISVTDLATGQRTLHEIAIDPATQSLQDVAAAINTVANVQAVIDPQTRTLTIVANTGHAFDFAARLPTAPQNVAVTGTAAPQIGGVYTGAANDNYTFSVVGSGTVGVTPNLVLEARNSGGQVIATWNIGQGYEPGANLAPVNGVQVRLSAGTVNNGDSFGTRVIAEPDTANLLGALGLNTLFQGGVGTLAVRSDLRADPSRLSASRTGLPADGANLARLARLRDRPLLNGATFNEYSATLAADVGGRINDLDQRQLAAETLGRNLEAERQNVSGVDPNEELLRMVQFQRAFQYSARFLDIVDETLDDLLRLV
jgi:flagellar hook-associated protein 1 FlgK